MRAVILSGKPCGIAMAPPSKSYAHRALICAALACGTSVIKNAGVCDDIKATLGALKALGAKIEINGRDATIIGCDAKKRAVDSFIDCNESGSTLRFLIPVFLLAQAKAEFTGCNRLFERPLDIYEQLCSENGLYFHKDGNSLCVSGPLSSSNFKLQGNVSSQFISGLLFALPLLEGDSQIELIPPVESRPYIDMTLETLEKFQIKIKQEGNTLYIPGGQSYVPTQMTVEGDWSGTAFLESFNTIGGKVEITGLASDSTQGDSVYRELFKTLCQEKMASVDISDCPDLGPVLMAVAAVKNGAVLTGTRRLRIKESARDKVMAHELAKFGVKVDVQENSVTVYKSELHIPTEPLESHNDHRIAMALSLPCSITGGEILGSEAVAKSFPDYWSALGSLCLEVTQYEH